MRFTPCGYSADLSGPVNDRAPCHIDNAYFLEHVEVISHRCKTHTVSNTAFCGFGGPQDPMIVESIIDDIARVLALDPLAVRRANFYGMHERNVTHYGQTIGDNVMHRLVGQLADEGQYAERPRVVGAWNASNAAIKRGIALTPVNLASPSPPRITTRLGRC